MKKILSFSLVVLLGFSLIVSAIVLISTSVPEVYADPGPFGVIAGGYQGHLELGVWVLAQPPYCACPVMQGPCVCLDEG